MTQGERTVNGQRLHRVWALRWGLYTLTAATQQAYDSGIGEWVVSYTDPTTLTMPYVDTWWSLSDALSGARAHSAREADRGVLR